MKKILAAILCAGLVAVTAAGCGYTVALAEAKRAQNTTSASQESQKETKPKEIKSTDYKNNLDGLVEYFDKKEYIANEEKNITVMDAASIGAKQGKKFAKRLVDCGVPLYFREYEKAYHGFVEVNRPDYFEEDARKTPEQQILTEKAEEFIIQGLADMLCSKSKG